MAVKIKFDSTHNAINPTFVLANRNGNKLGAIKAKDTRFADYLNSGSELFFYINKIENNQKCALWDKIEDFKLVWCKEWDTWFEIKVELDDENDTIKNITATSLGEAELSQIKLYGIQINTDDDIARDDYEKTVLYNESNPNASLLNRIMEKAPHYTIKYVADSIKNIQRTFTFDDISIYEAFQEISEEIDCIFIINSGTNSDGKIAREISVYDLESYCLDCKKRGEFGDTCSECGSTNIISGYGEDTTIFVSKENLADSITYSTDTDSVKNCFKLQAGDDLMTASLVNCNPNGTGYIWYISDQVRSDMSSELVTKLEDYDSTYEYYQKEHVTTISPESIATNYNDLVDKYSEQADAIDVTLSKISSSITGYPTLMQAYYDTIDFELFLESGLMPSLASLVKITAANEAGKLTSSALSPVAVQNINTCSVSTASSSVLAMAKIIVDSRYQVSVGDSSLSDGSETDTKTWTGNFVITNYSDEEDTATSETISVVINGDYEQFVKQKIDKTLSKSETDDLTATDIVSLFKLPLESEDSTATDTFENELKKYCLNYLEIFYDACHACMDVMIQQGVANDDLNEDLHSRIYLPYRNRLDVISNEISVRNDEIEIIVGKYDENGKLISDGMQSFISDTKESIQNELDFQKFLGDDLWLEFAAYRREDTYTNDNYISDGLNNAEIFQNALEFIEVAKKDIFKSATLQHSISASLKNLLTMKEFQRIVDYFEVGNWIRLKVDESVYRLRLVKYEISFSDLSKISVEFSDVKQVASGYSDIEDVIKQAASMSSSYNTTLRQAGQGKKSNDQINNWVNDGLALTKMKIIDNADNQNISWDSHGFTCKEYLPLTDTYDDRQLKIINRGLYTTDDNWITSKAGIGDFTFYNPKTGEIENAYGVIADTVVSNLTLSKNVGIYNEDGSIELNNKGFTLTTNDVDSETKNIFIIQKQVKDTDGTATIVPLLYVNDNGELVLNGSIQVVSSSGSSSSLEDTNNKVDEISSSKMYRVETQVTGSTIFNERDQQSTIECRVYSWDTDITPTLDSSQFIWHRHSSDEASDAEWDSYHIGMKSITVTTEDVYNNASFDCEVTIE